LRIALLNQSRDKKSRARLHEWRRLWRAQIKAAFKVRGLYYRVVCDVGRGLLTSLLLNSKSPRSERRGSLTTKLLVSNQTG